LPDPINAGVAKKLYRLDCGHSLANDESVWTPGENVGGDIEFSSTCWLVEHGSEWLLWDADVPQSKLNNPRGWSTLSKLIVYQLDRSLTDQHRSVTQYQQGRINRVNGKNQADDWSVQSVLLHQS
jgi:hypothetical protein